MNKEILEKLKKNPFGTAGRIIYKKLIGPLIYGSGSRLKAEQYWKDRFNKHGLTLRGPGDEGASENDNTARYETALKIVLDELKRRSIDLSKSHFLEIGAGNGFYSRALKSNGVTRYNAIDITDVLFDRIKASLGNTPGFVFTRGDITEVPIQGQFDVVLFIDVVEHIMTEERLRYALKNIWNALRPGGTLIFAPVMDRTESHIFYNRNWAFDDILRHLQNAETGPRLPHHFVSLHKRPD